MFTKKLSEVEMFKFFTYNNNLYLKYHSDYVKFSFNQGDQEYETSFVWLSPDINVCEVAVRDIIVEKVL